MNYGFVASKIDGTEVEFKEVKGFEIPSKYSYIKYLPDVIDQGRKPICVPCSVSAYINWNKNLLNGDNTHDNKVDLNQIFKNRTNTSDDGMSFKDAFKFLRHEGVNTESGVYKIGRYAKVGSELALKQSIIMNGPCVGGLPVYNSNSNEFWRKNSYSDFEGGHAIAVIGYNDDGFIIRNSWGKSYWDNGYGLVPYDEFDNFTELWTIIE
jgi:hypothetical protein